MEMSLLLIKLVKMKPDWSRTGPEPCVMVPYEGAVKRLKQTHPERMPRRTMEAERVVMHLYAMERPRLLAIIGG